MLQFLARCSQSCSTNRQESKSKSSATILAERNTYSWAAARLPVRCRSWRLWLLAHHESPWCQWWLYMMLRWLLVIWWYVRTSISTASGSMAVLVILWCVRSATTHTTLQAKVANLEKAAAASTAAARFCFYSMHHRSGGKSNAQYSGGRFKRWRKA